jgi:hypothetical protein
MSGYVLDLAYRVEEAGGVARYRAVTAVGEDACEYPAGANAPSILGITTHAQLREGKGVTVRRLGIAPCEAAGAIAAGARVCVADNEGRVKQAPSATISFGSSGANNAVVVAWRRGGLEGSAMTLTTQAEGADAALSHAFDGASLVVSLATDNEENAVTTAAELVAYLNTNAELAALVSATPGAGSNGSGVVLSGTWKFTGGHAGANVIGIAQQAATEAGDVVDVLLTH